MDCPVGHYCPANSSTPTVCPANTKSPEGSSLSSACINIAPSAFNSLTIDKYQIIWQGGGRECGRGTMTPGTYRVVLGGGRGGFHTVMDINLGGIAGSGGNLDHMFTITEPMSYQICSGEDGGAVVWDNLIDTQNPATPAPGSGGGGGSWLRLWNGTDINKVVAASDQYIVAGGGGGSYHARGFWSGGGGGGIGGGGGGGSSCYSSVCKAGNGGGSGPYNGGSGYNGTDSYGGVGVLNTNGRAASSACASNYGGGGGGCGSFSHCGGFYVCDGIQIYKGSIRTREFGGVGGNYYMGPTLPVNINGHASHPSNTPDPILCNSCAKIYRLR